MTRKCSWCGGFLGEKCSRCGNKHVTLIETGESDAAVPALFRCQPCAFTFEAGEGGRTDGICDACRQSVPPVLTGMLPPSVVNE